MQYAVAASDDRLLGLGSTTSVERGNLCLFN